MKWTTWNDDIRLGDIELGTVEVAATRYAASIIPTAKPGEVWEISTTDGITSRAMVGIVYSSEEHQHVSQFFGIYGRYTQSEVTSKRLLITAEGEYVG